MIDKLKAGDNYHLNNLTAVLVTKNISLQDENRAVETIEQIQDVNLDAKDIQDNIYTSICIGVIVSKKDSCFI